MGNGYGHEPIDGDGDGYYSGATSPGPYRRPSMARSSSSVFGDVEMAQDEVSRAGWQDPPPRLCEKHKLTDA